MQVSHMGTGPKGLGATSTAWPGHKQGGGLEMRQLGHELVSILDPNAYTARLPH